MSVLVFGVKLIAISRKKSKNHPLKQPAEKEKIALDQ